MMVWIGILIVIVTFVLVAKRYEARMVLFVSGVIMATLSGQLFLAFDKFTSQLVSASLAPLIATAIGYAYVIKYTGCDDHLARLLLRYISKIRPLMIPGAIFVTFFCNIALVAVAGTGAAIGPVAIPVMIKAGIHPAMAAAAVAAGGWGNYLSVGSSHTGVIADITGLEPIQVIGSQMKSGLICLVIVAIILTIIAHYRKEDKGYVDDTGQFQKEVDLARVNYIKAFMPTLPIILVIVSTPSVGWLPNMSVPQAMLLCTILLTLITWSNPAKVAISFFDGIGMSFRDIVSIIACAAAFTGGMEAIGVTGALIEVMKNSSSIASIAGAFGPFLIAIIGGSGDAATIAFNTSITPMAAEFGMSKLSLGSLAFLTGGLGREMSPVSGMCVLLAGIAGVNPLEITKRNAIPMVIATIVAMFVLVGL